MSAQGNFWKAVDKRAKKTNPAPVSIGEVLSLSPFSIEYNGITLSAENGDNIYINNLMLDENINLDKSTLNNLQDLKELAPTLMKTQTTSTNSFQAKISGTQLTFLTDFYDWVKAVHNRYILHIGDKIAVQKLGNNTYIVLNKLQKVTNE